MSSVTTSLGFGSPVQIVYFTEDAPGVRGTRLAAAVVWRIGPASDAHTWRRWWRRLRFRLRALSGGFHLRGSAHWAGSSGAHGEQETRYSAERRAVRVLGREYRAPTDGRTLVLLVDEGVRANRRPPVVVRHVIAPVVRHPAREPTHARSVDADQPHHLVALESQTWAAALETDPQVRAFMSGSPAA
jgi:hypothetical protein